MGKIRKREGAGEVGNFEVWRAGRGIGQSNALTTGELVDC